MGIAFPLFLSFVLIQKKQKIKADTNFTKNIMPSLKQNKLAALRQNFAS